MTALSMAVQEQHTAVVDALLLAGANVDLAEYVRTVVRKSQVESMCTCTSLINPWHACASRVIALFLFVCVCVCVCVCLYVCHAG